MRTFKILTAVALLAAGPVMAQQMYRCGSTFSQQPCGADAKAVPMQGVPQPVVAPPDTPASPEVVEAAKAACAARLKTDLAWKDPDSVKIGAVERRKTWHAPIDGKTVPARIYVLRVNAKNSYGGYTGEQPYLCNLDLGEKTVLSIQPLM